ncbi:FAD-dependent oxidoreductase [Georgenia sp. M64]|uniref:protoporphyrinogen/coproporphyrinogen oxidase n=1 Tax=Georgenia sp. M64 TaxID=3120520 RepID=UPI0030DF1E68
MRGAAAGPPARPDERADVVVVGGGMAGLSAAHAFLAEGLRPVVLEASSAVGGLVGSGVVGGYELDLGAEAFATRRPEVGDLVRSLGLEVVEPGAGSWVWTPERAFRIPVRTLLGVPADLGAADVVAALGPEAAAAAAVRDPGLPAHVGADAADLATLVRTRMGQVVLDRLVTPVAGGIHSADPADLAVDSVMPGLRAALTEHGTLAAAVAALVDATPGAAAASTAGGLFRLPRALAAAVRAGGGEVRTGATVTGLHAVEGGWTVDVDEAGGRSRTTAAHVVLALPEGPARELLDGVLTLPDAPAAGGSTITHVTLVVEAPALDAAPRGSGLLVPPGATGVRAKALTHVSAKWPWLREVTGPGVHVLRVSYGRHGERTDDVGAAAALADATTLLGVPLGRVLDHRVVRRTGVLAAATPAHRAYVTTVRARVAERPGLHLAGAWVAGTGLAAVVAQAQSLARSVATDPTGPVGVGRASGGAEE